MKIGIIRADRMGDMILTLPIIKGIKISNPNALIHVFCSEKNFKIVKNFKYIDKIYNIDKSFNANNKEKYDYILKLSPGWRSFFKLLLLKSSNKANILHTSRYKKKYSKIYMNIISKILFKYTLLINRVDRFKKNITIHQTEVMFELLTICKIKFNSEILIEKFLKEKNIIYSPKKICLIHLSSKWINKYYNENNLLILIKNLTNKFNVILTTDETSEIKFKDIFLKFPIAQNLEYPNYKLSDNVTIFKNLNFTNWISAIYSSSLIITPECGCTHIAGLCKIPSKIIYDADNYPHMINREYSPWRAKYEKFLFNENQLNFLLINNL